MLRHLNIYKYGFVESKLYFPIERCNELEVTVVDRNIFMFFAFKLEAP